MLGKLVEMFRGVGSLLGGCSMGLGLSGVGGRGWVYGFMVGC